MRVNKGFMMLTGVIAEPMICSIAVLDSLCGIVPFTRFVRRAIVCFMLLIWPLQSIHSV